MESVSNEQDSPWTNSPHCPQFIFVGTDDLKTLGERIRQTRKAKGLTQESLADKAKIDRSYVGGVERGERNLTFSMLCQLCIALGCDVAALTEGLPKVER